MSGKRVRRIEEVRDGGEVWIEWDGRDGAGDEIANGTYLYVATVDFVGVDRPPDGPARQAVPDSVATAA